MSGRDTERRLWLIRATEAPPDPPPTRAEEEAAARLASALEGGGPPLAVALRAAWSPASLSAADHELLVTLALGDDAPPGAEERAAAQAPSEEPVTTLSSALRSAVAPSPLDPDVHEAILARALGEQGAAPVRQLAPRFPSEELAAAAALREALEHGRHHPGADLLRALRAAARPAPLPPLSGERLGVRALAARPPRQRSRQLGVGAVALLATAAAAFALLVERPANQVGERSAENASPGDTLLRARSTAELFDPAEPFPRVGGATARIDRIALVRGRELRQNRYLRWGIR